MVTALEGGEGSASRPGRFFPPGKTRYPLYRRLGGPQGRSSQVWKDKRVPEVIIYELENKMKLKLNLLHRACISKFTLFNTSSEYSKY